MWKKKHVRSPLTTWGPAIFRSSQLWPRFSLLIDNVHRPKQCTSGALVPPWCILCSLFWPFLFVVKVAWPSDIVKLSFTHGGRHNRELKGDRLQLDQVLRGSSHNHHGTIIYTMLVPIRPSHQRIIIQQPWDQGSHFKENSSWINRVKESLTPYFTLVFTPYYEVNLYWYI